MRCFVQLCLALHHAHSKVCQGTNGRFLFQSSRNGCQRAVQQGVGRERPLPPVIIASSSPGPCASEPMKPVQLASPQGIVHRDIKPSNMLRALSPAAAAACAAWAGPPPLLVKLGDFGVARALGGAEGACARTLVGTPYYLAPELVQASAPRVTV